MTDVEDPTDDELVERFRRGDERAFQILYERYAAQLERDVTAQLPRRIRRRLSVADIVQEAYTTAFRKLREDEGPREDAFRAWLRGIAEHKAREASRYHLDTAKRAARREISSHQRPDTRAFGSRRPTPSMEAVANELGEAVDSAVEALPEDYRTILRLVHDCGMEVREAAGHLGRSPEATRKLYARAVDRLARELDRQRGKRDA